MSTKGESDVYTEGKDAISVMLTPKNYLQWNEDAALVCGKLYGNLADVLTTKKAYRVPLPVEKDYLPPLEPGQAPYSDASKERFKEKAYDRYYTKVEKYNELRPKMYSTLLSSFSIESK
eukprot:gene21180-29079_t